MRPSSSSPSSEPVCLSPSPSVPSPVPTVPPLLPAVVSAPVGSEADPQGVAGEGSLELLDALVNAEVQDDEH